MSADTFFICIEGGDATGKDTATAAIVKKMEEYKRKVFLVQDPGTTPLGRKLREILMNPDIECTPAQQLLLFTAARSSIVAEIHAKLAEGYDVVSNRWYLSTLVYQCDVLGCDERETDWLHKTFVHLYPYMSFVLDLPVEEAMARRDKTERDKDRFDSKSVEFHEEVREAYKRRAGKGNRTKVVNAALPPNLVAQVIWCHMINEPEFYESISATFREPE